MTVTVVDFVKDPLVPFTSTVYVPATPELTVRIEVPEPRIVPVLKIAVRPVEGVVVTEMVPANPFNAEIVMVEVPEMPVMRARVDGLAETMKSTTVNVAVVL